MKTKFITVVIDESDDVERGFCVPLPGEPIIEWRDAQGETLAQLVIGGDGRTVEVRYPTFGAPDVAAA